MKVNSLFVSTPLELYIVIEKLVLVIVVYVPYRLFEVVIITP